MNNTINNNKEIENLKKGNFSLNTELTQKSYYTIAEYKFGGTIAWIESYKNHSKFAVKFNTDGPLTNQWDGRQIRVPLFMNKKNGEIMQERRYKDLEENFFNSKEEAFEAFCKFFNQIL